MSYERDDYMRRQEADHDLLRMRTRTTADIKRHRPGPYWPCCGMSCDLGHAAFCSHNDVTKSSHPSETHNG